jgi:hypothetical protein
MTNNNNHQSVQRVFSSQPHTVIEQLLPTSGIVSTGQRTNGYHPARQTRSHPLDVDSDISRDSTRLPADPAGEWSSHPMQTNHGITNGIRNRSEAVPTHIRPAKPNPQRDTHLRQVATLVHFDLTRNTESRTNIPRPNTGSKTYTSVRAPGRGTLPIDPDNSQKAFTHAQRPRRGVRQDKGVLTNDRPASPQPAPGQNGSRSLGTPTKNVCSQTRFVHKHKTVPLPLHVDPLLKAEIQRIAEAEGLSVSQVGATGLGEWVHQRLHDQHEDVLYPVLRQLIRDEPRAFGNRIVFFLIRIAFAAEQSRILITNVLHKLTIQMGLPIDKFNELVDKSNKMARRNIIARSPEIKTLMKEWEASHEDDKEAIHGKEKK